MSFLLRQDRDDSFSVSQQRQHSFARKSRTAVHLTFLVLLVVWVANLIHLENEYEVVKRDDEEQRRGEPEPLVQRHLVEVESLENQATDDDDTEEDSKVLTIEGLRILVGIASFDFSQRPHMEELLDSYHDLCVSGALVDVIVHSAAPYPVVLIDMLNSRFDCEGFTVTIILKPKTIRLHLVDCHRALFYEKLNDYDLFIYSEDDIRITPHTVATYWQETNKIQTLVENTQYKPSDFNVGVVRYEFNYPSVVLNDKTRDVTKDVSRVYWEHSGWSGPIVPDALDRVEQEPLKDGYMAMRNTHQGMYLATRELLEAWRDRPKCEFNVASNRPGHGKNAFQPLLGTQRVWISSYQLYNRRHGCGVQQVIPMDRLDSLTLHHLANKNYRRVGKYRTREFDKVDVERPLARLLTAMDMHLSVRKRFPLPPSNEYKGPIRMVDEVNKQRTPELEKAMQEYNEYVQRGGSLTEEQLLH